MVVQTGLVQGVNDETLAALLGETAAALDRRVLSLLIYAQSVDLVVPEEPIRSLFEQIYPQTKTGSPPATSTPSW